MTRISFWNDPLEAIDFVMVEYMKGPILLMKHSRCLQVNFNVNTDNIVKAKALEELPGQAAKIVAEIEFKTGIDAPEIDSVSA